MCSDSGLELPNFKNSYVGIACPVMKTRLTIEGTFRDIFSEDIPQYISKTLLKVSELRENLL
jgi:hypothetical protein